MTDPRRSNQGRLLTSVLNDIRSQDLTEATDIMHTEFNRHPAGAKCECPLLEALALLYERGYRLQPVLVAPEGEG